jgi:basic amino acid/polyamine antiporter, APA family
MGFETTSSPPPRGGLRRDIGWLAATAVVVANMVGTGIFTTTGILAQELGSPWRLLAVWAVGGLVALAGAACYAELATAFPASGGEYVYLRAIYGELPAFLSGWISFVVGFSAPTAAAALAFSAYLEPFHPALGAEVAPLLELGPVVLRLGPAQALAIGVVWLLAAVHTSGVRTGSRVQGLLTSWKVMVLAALILAALAVGRGDWSHLRAVASPPASGSLASSFALSLILVMFSYSGFNAAAYLGGEVRDPRRTLPRALALGTGLVVALYLVLNLVFLFALPLASYHGRIDVGATAATALFGPRVSGAFGVLMAAALLSTVSAMMMTGPRVTWAMAQQGAFPAWAGRVSHRSGAPTRAIVIQAVLATAMIITGTFLSLLIFIGFALSFFAALTVFGLLLHRWRGGAPGRYRAPLVPFTPLLFCGVSLWMMGHTMIRRPVASLTAVAVMGAGAIVYAVGGRRRRVGEAKTD